MYDVPRQKLCELIATYGRSLCDDPRRCEGLLRDLCGEHRREIHVLVSALKERVAVDILSSSASSLPHEVLLTRLTKRLQDNLGLAEDAARWAVDSWALALGTISIVREVPSPTDQLVPDSNSPEQVKRGADKKRKTATEQPSSDIHTSTVNVDKRLELLGVRVVDRRASSGLSAEREIESQPSGGKRGDDILRADEQSSSTKSGGVLEIIGGVLLVPVALFGSLALILGSALIACLPFFLVFWTVGIDYDQLGGTAQGLLGLLMLALTVVVAGLLGGVLAYGWDVLKRKVQGYLGLQPK